jgi:hypothetical protein
MGASFKAFVLFYFGTIALGLLTAFLIINNYTFYFLSLLIITIMGLEGLGCSFFVNRLSKKLRTKQAEPDEIKREDDVLLQGTPFISAILFFYLNILISNTDYKLLLGLTIVLGTGTFYITRGLAKIKSNHMFRFYSIFFLVFLATGVSYELIAIALATFVFPIVTIPFMVEVLVIAALVIIVFLPVDLAIVYFPVRYGARIPKLMKYFGEGDLINSQQNDDVI